MNKDIEFIVATADNKNYFPFKVLSFSDLTVMCMNQIFGLEKIRFYPGQILRVKQFFHYLDDVNVFAGFKEGYNSFTSRCQESEITCYFNKNYFLHREDGPALVMDSVSYFYLNGKRFKNSEDWFEALPDKKAALFNLDKIIK